MVKKQWGGQNRLEGSRAESPLLVLRVSESLLETLKRVADKNEKKASTFARELLEKALELEGRRS